MANFTQNFIGGKRVDPLGPNLISVYSPYDGSFTGATPEATTADVDLAINVARKAFDNGPWSRMAPAERQAILTRFSALHAARADEFARLITSENGSPIFFTNMVQGGIAAQNAAYLKAAAGYPWEVRQAAFPRGETVWRREAIGVVAAIIPWNAPHQSALVKLFPALLAGNSVVLKLAPETALDGQFLGELFTEAGVPAGVLSILAAGREVSEYLVAHPGVDKIAFTGSTAAGRRIAAVAGAQLKRVSFELGGKSAAIILPDADIAMTVGALHYASFPNAGQSCVAQTRILVPQSRHDEFVATLVADVAAMTIGNPADPNTYIGPLVAERQRAHVAGYIDRGITEGATVAIGGPGLPDGINQGAFVKPTVFANVDNGMAIAQEEIFGPVVCVIPYDMTSDAVRIANASDYGLAGSVWTADPELGLSIARQIRTGTFQINGKGPDFLAPFGGYKHSGIGREFGTEGLNHYVEHKAISL